MRDKAQARRAGRLDLIGVRLVCFFFFVFLPRDSFCRETRLVFYRSLVCSSGITFSSVILIWYIVDMSSRVEPKDPLKACDEIDTIRVERYESSESSESYDTIRYPTTHHGYRSRTCVGFIRQRNQEIKKPRPVFLCQSASQPCLLFSPSSSRAALSA